MSECDYEHEMSCDSQLDVLTEIKSVEGISLKLSPCLEKSSEPFSLFRKVLKNTGWPSPERSAAAAIVAEW